VGTGFTPAAMAAGRSGVKQVRTIKDETCPVVMEDKPVMVEQRHQLFIRFRA
jgi:hypothetical protein